MGYQESCIYTNNKDIEKNNEDIKDILNLLKKYDIRLSNDNYCECIGILKVNERISSKYEKDMEMLVFAGERSEQKNQRFLFNICYGYNSDFTDKEFDEYIPAQYRYEDKIKKEDIGINIPKLTKEELELIDRIKIVFIYDDNLLNDKLSTNTSFIGLDDYLKNIK